MSFTCCFTVQAAEVKSGYITDDGVRVRTSPTTLANNRLVHNGSNIMLYTGHRVEIIELVTSPDDTKYPSWYNIRFTYNSTQLEGYVCADYVKVVETPSGDVELPTDVPDIYKDYIEELLKWHPNWKFAFYDTGIEWSSLFEDDAQGARGKNVIYYTLPLSYRSTEPANYNWKTDTWISPESNFYQASDETIMYYMDPRNFLNEQNVFMFECLSYDSDTQTIDGVEKIIDNSFMETATIKDTSGNSISYAEAYMQAAAISNVSPFHLASRTIQEVGTTGDNKSVSGKCKGYEGYYNFYNIMAHTGSEDGLYYATGKSSSAEAKEKYMLPWNSQYKAIVGGAKWIGNGYINNNQDTLYYQKFNVVNKNWNHQYMANLTAPATESVHIYKTYENLGILDHSFTFIIPIFKNMPETAVPKPESNNFSPNNWLKSLEIKGYNLSFDGAKTNYSLSVSKSVSSITVSATPVSSKSTVKGTGKISLNEGINHIRVNVTAENGDLRTYTIEVSRGETEKIPLKSISLNKTSLNLEKGSVDTLVVTYNPTDTTDDKTVTWSSSNNNVVTVSDGKITAVGKGEAVITAKVGSFTATCKVLVSENNKLGDVNLDGKINSLDARIVLQYSVGSRELNDNQLVYADVNCDGKISSLDARKILQKAAGII